MSSWKLKPYTTSMVGLNVIGILQRKTLTYQMTLQQDIYR